MEVRDSDKGLLPREAKRGTWTRDADEGHVGMWRGTWVMVVGEGRARGAWKRGVGSTMRLPAGCRVIRLGVGRGLWGRGNGRAGGEKQRNGRVSDRRAPWMNPLQLESERAWPGQCLAHPGVGRAA
jgi:hypothetical protein